MASQSFRAQEDSDKAKTLHQLQLACTGLTTIIGPAAVAERVLTRASAKLAEIADMDPGTKEMLEETSPAKLCVKSSL